MITGSSSWQSIQVKSIQEEAFWGGSKTNLIDTFEYGSFLFKLIDYQTKNVIYSRGFSNLFSEWQTTTNSVDTAYTFSDCQSFPAPKNKSTIKLFKRDSNLIFQEIYELTFDPDTILLVKADTNNRNVKYIHKSRAADKALDIVIVSEGYTKQQSSKFYKDVERFKAYLFNWKPYNKYKDNINIIGVYTPSLEEGLDNPKDSTRVETAFDCRQYTFKIDRYLSVPDITKVYDRLIGIPVDQVCILVNSDIYGGGGIFNNYTIFTADHYSAGFLFLHEFGHSFAGLADEYTTSETTNNSRVREDLEPIAPNITTLVNFNKKWSHLVLDSIPLPTPDSSIYKNIIGAFEGASYQKTGVYRSEHDCAMRSANYTRFCTVCQQSIEKMIRFYIE
jgi:hypothetical protein